MLLFFFSLILSAYAFLCLCSFFSTILTFASQTAFAQITPHSLCALQTNTKSSLSKAPAISSSQDIFMGTRMNDQLQPMVEGPPAAASEDSERYAHRSIETLVVVLAVITIVGVIAGIVARLCGGRHFGGNGEHDIEGWVERKCRSCIDGGVPAAAAAPAAAAEESKPAPPPAAAAAEEKK